jgi:hypothetical protein
MPAAVFTGGATFECTTCATADLEAVSPRETSPGSPSDVTFQENRVIDPTQKVGVEIQKRQKRDVAATKMQAARSQCGEAL